jgi:hypothetical protein
MAVRPPRWHDRAVTESSPRRLAPARLAAGLVAALAAAVLLTAFVGSLYNPQGYVVLRTYAGNPFAVAFLALIATTVAVWLLVPVRAEAEQGRRVAVRWTLVVLTVLAGVAYGLTIGLTVFVYQGRVAAHSPDGRYDLALVDRGGEQRRELRVWRGHGLATRDLGSFGDACGDPVDIRFTGPDSFDLSTNYGTFHLTVDAAGRPASSIGPTCSG